MAMKVNKLTMFLLLLIMDLVVDFQSKPFLEKYKEKFLQVVDAHAIRMRLEIDGVIPKKLSFDMDKTSSDEATELLYLHLRDHATSHGIHKLCAAMISKTGYGNMVKLGDKMKSDEDLPPYSMYAIMHIYNVFYFHTHTFTCAYANAHTYFYLCIRKHTPTQTHAHVRVYVCVCVCVY